MESFYFAFITLSTMGFGNYVIRERLGAGRAGTQLPASSRPWHPLRCLVGILWGDLVNLAHSLPAYQALPFPSMVD